MWNLLIGGVVDLATSHFKNKADEKKAVHERKMKQISNETDWEKIQAQNAGSSLKDEWFVALLSVPLIGAFLPEFRPYIEDGFMCLRAMPEYYKVWLSAAIASSFGLRGLAKWKR